jgi:hypothetical protein
MCSVFRSSIAAAALAAAAIVSPAHARTLDFDQLVNGTAVGNTFSDVGVGFSSNANEQKQGFNGNAPSGGTGKVENNPSGLSGVLTADSRAVSCVSTPTISKTDPSAKDEFCTWSIGSASNFGNGESILFGPTGSSNLQLIEFDDVQLTPTPLPAALPLFAGGLGALDLLGWRQKRTARSVAA